MLPPTDFEGIVVGAGSATRFGASLPKQFHDLAGRSVLRRAVDCLAASPAVRDVVVVLAPAELGGEREREVVGWPGVRTVVPGGGTRAESVLCGARAARASHVLVHDAARPLAARALVERVLAATREHGAAIPAIAVGDTVKRTGDGRWIEATLERGELRLAQTPQGARRDWLCEALERQLGRSGPAATDEAAALELAGRRVAIVEGDAGNVKITTQADLERARRALGPPRAEWRVGTGFDIHRAGADRELRLGGVGFPGAPGLAGHSDADVVLHAVMDALLGAAGLGDIGTLFPPDDPGLAGADSRGLCRSVAARVREAGWEPVNVDLTLLAELPRIRGRAEEMRGAIAGCLGIEPGRVGVKATTLEGLGALGRREGLACQAVCLLAAARSP